MSKITKAFNEIIENNLSELFINDFEAGHTTYWIDKLGLSAPSLKKLAASMGVKAPKKITIRKRIGSDSGQNPQKKMFRLIEAIKALTVKPMTSEELGVFLDCTKRTAYRYLHLFVDAGFDIQKDSNDRYYNNMSIDTKIIDIPESWQYIEGTNYAVSNKGRVKYTGKNKTNTHTDRIVSPQNNKGHLFISLTSGDEPMIIGVAKLVAKFFLPNPYNFSKVGFKDNNPLNCDVENLFWKKSSLDFSSYESSYLEMATEARIPVKDIANELGVKPKHIVDILTKTFRATPNKAKSKKAYIVADMLLEGKNRKEISDVIGLSISSVDYYISTYGLKPASEIDKQKIKSLHEEGKKNIEIAKTLGISLYTVYMTLKTPKDNSN